MVSEAVQRVPSGVLLTAVPDPRTVAVAKRTKLNAALHGHGASIDILVKTTRASIAKPTMLPP